MRPLAERLRPQTLQDYLGQEELLGPKGSLSKVLGQGTFPQ